MRAVGVVAHTVISIHALLAESDLPAVKRATDEFGISIHALLAESDRRGLAKG